MAYPWLTPDPSVATTVVSVLLAAASLIAAFTLGPRLYRRLAVARTVGGSAVGYYRRLIAVQVARCVLVVVVVAADGGISRSDVGLVWPRGPHAGATWAWAGYAAVLLVLSVGVLRARVRRGHTVPGQRLFVAIVARPSERGWATAVAVGAGVSEELVFRGLFVAVAVGALNLSPVVAVAVLAVVFGLAHVYQGVLGVVGTTIVGGLFGGLFLASQSLLVPVLVHVAVDLRALVLVPVATPRPAPAPPVRLPRAPRPATWTPQSDDEPPRLP